MKYKIGNFILDVQARSLSEQDNCQHIRPKTLEVLLYLGQRSGQIISKQELLDHVWDDVNVDEGVVFQSIREIRQLFDNNNIVQNYPRKGYVFNTELCQIAQQTQSEKLSPLKYIFTVCLFVLLFGLLTHFFIDESQDITYEQSIVVLPVKNQMIYGENDWLYLGAMEQLIAKLKGLPNSIFVYQGTYIPRLMHIAGLKRNFNSSDILKIFTTSGATLIVETEVHGNVSDYKLVYKFHIANDVKQGVILDTSINGALMTLSKKIATFINHPLKRSDDVPMKEFSDALFAEAMISYESDWKTSISFFESYLVLNPDSVIAMIYLSKLYLWSDKIEQAEILMSKATKNTRDNLQEDAHINLVKGRIAAKQQHWQQAMSLYNQAANTIENQPNWFLKASIAEEQGLAYLEQELLKKSAQAFKKALSFYQIIQSPIGINSTRLHLANVEFQKGNIEEAIATYNQAKQNIQQINLEFLYSMLDDYENKFEKYLINKNDKVR